MNIFLVIILWMIGGKLGMTGGYYAILTISAILWFIIWAVKSVTD